MSDFLLLYNFASGLFELICFFFVRTNFFLLCLVLALLLLGSNDYCVNCVFAEFGIGLEGFLVQNLDAEIFPKQSNTNFKVESICHNVDK